MSEEIAGDSFKAARKTLERTYEEAIAEAKSKVEKAKSEALRKLKA